jgi:hypothetical protein
MDTAHKFNTLTASYNYVRDFKTWHANYLLITVTGLGSCNSKNIFMSR